MAVHITSTQNPAISTERTRELRAYVLVALNRPTTTVIRHTVPITSTTVIVTSTESTSVVRGTVLGSGEAVTATTISAQVTPITVRAI